jgi:pilus assembly protein CpaF
MLGRRGDRQADPMHRARRGVTTLTDGHGPLERASGDLRQGTVGPGLGQGPRLLAPPTDAEAARLHRLVLDGFAAEIGPDDRADMDRRELVEWVDRLFTRAMEIENVTMPLAVQRDVMLRMVASLEAPTDVAPHSGPVPPVEPSLSKIPPSTPSVAVGPDPFAELEMESGSPADTASRKAARDRVEQARKVVAPILMDRIDIGSVRDTPREELAKRITGLVGEIVAEQKVQLNAVEQRELIRTLVDDMTGLGPLEVLLADDQVTDIMVNGPHQIYVEKRGKLQMTDVAFRDQQHAMNVATRIVTRVGRRVDESSPLVDARLEDGSRVNVIMPPLAIDGVSISIRKFAKYKLNIDQMVRQLNMSAEMGTVLKIAARSRLNILISGGTGSGKTTLLNALSQMIDPGERIVTIEDAAELKLQQPHVVRLETRPANLEGLGEITMRDLLKNALRMRPDRIILGEVRGAEAMDVLQAMNTGHDGSLCTLHANNPRETLTRLENMTTMAGFNLPASAIRTQISDAVDMIVQISRMRDGKRRVTQVVELVGREGDVITTQDLFKYEFDGEDNDGNLVGRFVSSRMRPHFLSKASYFGLDKRLIDAMGCNG